VQLALPALEAMGQAALPRRFGVWYWGNGCKPPHWVPAQTGAAWQLSDELAPLAKVKPYINLVTGTAIKTGNPQGHHAGQVGVMSGAPLISQPPKGAPFASTFARASMDQVAAAAIGKTTRFKSLEVGVLRHNSGGEGTGLLYVSHNGPDSPN